MKTRTVGHFGSCGNAARVAVIALALAACKEMGTKDRSPGAGPAAGVAGKVSGASVGPTGGVAEKASGASVAPAGTARPLPSPELEAELAHRRTAWIQKPLVQGENKMTPERLRRMEMSRFELTSLAQEAAMIDMGLGDADKAVVRRILTEFRDAVLLRIERPQAGADRKSSAPDDLLGGVDDPSAPRSLYAKRLREALGEPRHGELDRFEREERAKLIAARRAYRRSGVGPAPFSSHMPR